jgi:CDP-diacylglycerol--glycerol-3-phosphate 3-phosphatidyltransferase
MPRGAVRPHGILARIRAMNLPNILTVVRILLVPVLLLALLEDTPEGDLMAAIVFTVASATDFLDGYLARSRNLVTTFGKVMDPLADKLLVIGALLALVSLERLAAWVAMVIIARELAVTALRTAAAQQGVIVPAGTFGKIKTVAQIAAILALIAAGASPLWVDLLVYLMVVLTVASGIDYFFTIRKRMAEAEAAVRAGARTA